MAYLIDKDTNIIKGCGIEFPYFGASYPDARCIDGYLWDMDSGEKDEDACEAAIKYCLENLI